MASTLVIGATGQVGTHLRELLPAALFWSRNDADLSVTSEVERRVREASPAIIINAAAYTAVDRAETEPELAWRVNAEANAALARAAEHSSAVLIALSTDYVFDGNAARPYGPDDPAQPASVYGRSKLAGELAIRTLCTRYLLFRTSWLFSEYGSNFVKTMIRLGQERKLLRVVADQVGVPVYAGDVAEAIARSEKLLRSGTEIPWGTYHLCGGQSTSWHGFAREIFRQASSLGLLAASPELDAIETQEYPTLAPRPAYSVLAPSNSLLTRLDTTLDWTRGLQHVLIQLQNDKNGSSQ